MDEKGLIEDAFVHLTRLSLTGKDQDVAVFVQRIARKHRARSPEFSSRLTDLLRRAPSASSPLRRAAAPLPVDAESRMSLAEVSWPTTEEVRPILTDETGRLIDQLIEERKNRAALIAAHLSPTRTAIFVGPPGVGKTIAARWIASTLQLPLLVLDLSSVMSSLLGRTGVNVRQVMEYARQQECVLLLDEIDAIGKRRDDPSDIGELKRLVNVLLQQIDQWPIDGSLLIAATNHPDLLDPAIWRRFETMIEFDLPDAQGRTNAIRRFLDESLPDGVVSVVTQSLAGASFSDIATVIGRAKRAAALGKGTLDQCLLSEVRQRIARLDAADRRRMATELYATGEYSQRLVRELTGVSRDTIRKRVAPREE